MTGTRDPRHGLRRAILSGCVLVAFALRAHRLGAQSLWSDEDITLDRVGRTLSDLLASLPVEHAPAYFVVARLWTRLAGDGDLALRAPSLFFGALAVPLAGWVGGRLLGPRAGLIAALLAAVNPFLVWYGQEARMYAMVAALALAALAATLRALAGARQRWWVVAGLLAAAVVYTHYFGALLVMVLGAWAVLDVARRGRSAAVGWLAAGVAAFLAFAPWLDRAFGVLAFPGWRDPVPLARAPWIVLSSWSAGMTASPGPARWIALFYAGLAGLGLAVVIVRAFRGPRRVGAQRALIYAIVPLVTVVALVARQPDFHPRYFLAVVPAFYLLVAAGAAALPAPGAVAAAALLMVAAAPPLANLYADPAHQKQDYRAVIARVESGTGPRGSALLLDGPPFGMMDRYRSDDSRVRIVNLQSNALRHLPEERLFAEIAERALPYADVWLAEDGSTSGSARRWIGGLAETVYPVEESAVQNITLARYRLPRETGPKSTAPAPSRSRVPPLDLVVTAPELVSAGDVLAVDLAWSPPKADSAGETRPMKVSLRLVDDAGRISAAVDRGTGHPAGQGAPRPAADAIVERHGLLVPVDTDPAAFTLEIVLYDAETLGVHGVWRWPVAIHVSVKP